MKAVIACLLLVLCVSSVSSCQDGRDLITGFLTPIKGEDFHLNDACLDAEFDQDLENLLEAVKANSLEQVVDIGKKILNETNVNCNLNEFKQLFNDYNKAFFSGYIGFNFFFYNGNFLVLVKKQLNNKNRTAYSDGEFGGNLFNLLVYGKIPYISENFLAEEELYDFQLTDDLVKDVQLFVEGLLIGVSTDPEHNQCRSDIQIFKNQLVNAVKEIAVAIQTRQNIVQSIFNLVNVIAGLPDFEGTCNLGQLKQNLASLKTKIGLMEVVYRLGSHPVPVFTSLQQFVTAIKISDFQSSGTGLGKFLSLALGWATY